MRLEFEDLSRFRHQLTMVDGGFDPLHLGHLEYFTEAGKLGLPLLCNVAADRYVETKHPVLLPEEQRVGVLDGLRAIQYTHLNRTSTEAVLGELRPKYYVKGLDWKGRLPEEQLAICATHGIEVVYLDTVRGSSSAMVDAICKAGHRGFEAQAAAFEHSVFQQAPTPAAQYDQDYFVAGWRAGDNNYTVEARRPLEGRNPELIASTFRPAHALDLGCGPGALMFLLQEQGVVADGVDFSPSCKALAPPEVRDRILTAPVTAIPAPDNTYDLVICREVVEHLTVLEVRQAVREMCRVTARFVYLTTRFHPDPAGLLDWTTQFEVDPTHITLLNKAFLRVLFTLEGLRRRPDLESAMDWMGKGRVLVYEKP